MIRSLLRAHPDHAVLSQVADRELSATELMQVNAHLAECRECREEVDFIVDLRLRLENLTGPEPDETLLTDILRRRAAGERTILVADEPVEEILPSRKLRTAVSAAAMVALFAGGFALFAAGGAEAGLNRLVPELSPAGTVTSFTFGTTGPSMEADRLRLRAAYHDRADRPWESTAPLTVDMELVRTGRGTFESLRALPASVVYARFAVETLDGEIVPAAGDGREHLALGPDGLPTLAALLRKVEFEYQVDENDRAALKTARVLTSRFADQPLGWFWRCAVECGTSDAVRAIHTRRLTRFLSELPPDPSTDHLAALVYYAGAIDVHDEGGAGAERRLELLEKLETVAPHHPVVAQHRVERVFELAPGGAEEMLAELERLWKAGYAMSSDAFVPALIAAAQEGGDAALRWYDRWIVTHPEARLEAARTLAELVAPSPAVIDRLHDAVRWAGDDRIRRPVGRSVTEHQWEIDSHKFALSRPVTRYLLETGRPRAALRSIAWARHLASRPEVVDLLAEVAGEFGDREMAVENHLFGWVMPLQSEERRQAHRDALIRMGLGSTELEHLADQARTKLLDRALRGTTPMYVEGPITVEAAGVSFDLMSALGPVTILSFGSAGSPSTRERLRALAIHCPLLEDHGIRLLPVFDEEIGSDERTVSCGSRPLVDALGKARTGLATRLFVEIVVLDREGRVRFRGSDPDAAVRAAILLADTA